MFPTEKAPLLGFFLILSTELTCQFLQLFNLLKKKKSSLNSILYKKNVTFHLTGFTQDLCKYLEIDVSYNLPNTDKKTTQIFLILKRLDIRVQNPQTKPYICIDPLKSQNIKDILKKYR